MAYDHNSEWEKIENQNFELIKDLTILAATVFGMSIALAVGKQGNFRFILGEFLLFVALCCGVIILYSNLRGKEFFHFLMTSSDLKFNLPKRVGDEEDFIVKAQADLIKKYDELAEKSKGGFLSFIFKIIKIDYFYPTFLLTFLLGTFFIFFSLIDLEGFIELLCYFLSR